MDTIRWLHLSDIHYNLDNYESEWLRDNLIETLKSQNGKFDFLVITGDLLYQFNSLFDEVKTFLMSIINIISIPLENVFMILGNHDFERNKKREIFIRGIKSDKEKIKDMVADLDDDMINILIKGQKEFWEFYEDLWEEKTIILMFIL
jgi:predicted MPP superfamily phosphohydrolase